MKNIYEYNDFRTFLTDFYAEKKAERKSYSYRFIASKVGFKSAGHFTQILKGQADISLQLAHRFAEFFGLNKKETEYFEALVLFNQAQTHKEKKLYYERIISFKESTVKELDADQYEYFSKWYYTAVREILNFFPFKGNFEELAKMVEPSITTDQARESVALLEKLGMIVRNEDGSYSLTQLRVSSGYSQSPAAGNSLLNSLQLAEKALDRIPKNERELSTLTISTSEEGYAAIIKELQAFRRRILDMTAAYLNPTRAYHFDFLVFPVSKPLPGEKHE